MSLLALFCHVDDFCQQWDEARMQRILLLLWAYACAYCGQCSGLSFIESTPVRVCFNHRISRHKVFAGLVLRLQAAFVRH